MKLKAKLYKKCKFATEEHKIERLVEKNLKKLTHVIIFCQQWGAINNTTVIKAASSSNHGPCSNETRGWLLEPVKRPIYKTLPSILELTEFATDDFLCQRAENL